MHTQQRIDLENHKNLRLVFPCWDCPGMVLPAGVVSSDRLCQQGSLQPVHDKFLTKLFRNPARTRLCLKTGNSESDLLHMWRQANHSNLGLCHAASDVDCVVTTSGQLDEHQFW